MFDVASRLGAEVDAIDAPHGGGPPLSTQIRSESNLLRKHIRLLQ